MSFDTGSHLHSHQPYKAGITTHGEFHIKSARDQSLLVQPINESIYLVMQFTCKLEVFLMLSKCPTLRQVVVFNT
jgi:hypothetical protein